jgi:hypothetical protein
MANAIYLQPDPLVTSQLVIATDSASAALKGL